MLTAVPGALLRGVAAAASLLALAPLGGALGVTVFALAAMGHESGHLTASRNRFVNDLVGALTMSLVFMPARGWKVYHDVHHRHTGVLGIDTDAQYTVAQYVSLPPGKRRAMRWVCENEFLFWPLGALIIAGINWSYSIDIVRRPEAYARRVRAWNRVDMAVACPALCAAGAFGMAVRGVAVFFGNVIPYAIRGVMCAGTFYTDHRD